MIPAGSGPDDLQNRLTITFDLRVVEAQDAESLRCQPVVARRIIDVKRAVRFYDQPMSEADEIRHERTERNLSAEFETGQIPALKEAP